MTVLIASSFTKSLDRLTGQEQAAAKITAFDIQSNPDSPGLSLHRINNARDPDFWSARVNRDIRIVLHKRGGDTLLAYIGHHDDAYAWAERRRLERHPKTGAAQIVEVRETVQKIVTQRYVEEEIRKPALFASESDETLLSWGVPEDWLETVREATDDTVLDIAGHLPDEAQEAVLAAAVGEAPTVRIVAQEGSGYAHPDAQRRFRVIGDQAELEAALDAPFDDWAVFLHPAQREFVDRDFNGAARVIGSAGTGKTVVALHRAVRLADEAADNRVLLTTFSPDLAKGLSRKLARLTGGRPDLARRITVDTLPEIARGLVPEDLFGRPAIASEEEMEGLLADAAEKEGTDISPGFLAEEWRLIVDAWDVRDQETYRELPRLGRKVRMAASRRDELWRVFARMRNALEQSGKETEAGLMHRLARELDRPPFTHVVVDEAQDISVPELHFVAALAGDRPNGLFFAGDIGQRIFRSPFPWKAVGVDIQGRSRSLKVNYRTSHQIRSKSDLLLPPRLLEVDGGEDRRLGVSSVFHGPTPELHVFDDEATESARVGGWIDRCLSDKIDSTTIAVLVRSAAELPRAQAAIAAASMDSADVRVGLMHDAKGREFRAVAVMACDTDVLPSEARLLQASDERALKEIYDTERHLLYVAATRARERLWLSACKPPSEFLEDLLREAAD